MPGGIMGRILRVDHPEEAWPIMKRNYYRTMGWDEETGMPLPERLRNLDLEELVSDFPVRA